MRLFIAVALLCFAACAAAEVASVGGCSNALVIPGPYNGQVVFADTTGAATYEQNVCNLNTNAGTYFYVITPTANAPMNISTCHADTTFDTVLAIFQGDDCDSLQCVAGNDDTSCTEATNASSIQFTPTGGSYWVMVSGYGTATGEFEISFKQGAVTEVACNSAVTIHGPFDPPVSIFDSLSGNSTQAEQPCSANSNMLGNWYIIYPTPGTEVTATTCGDYFGFDTEIAVLVGPNCNQLECVGYSDDNCDTAGALSTVVFSATESPFYYVYVTGYGTSSGSYYLTISERPTAPPQGGCSDAFPLPGPGVYREQTNENKPTMEGMCGLTTSVEYPAAWYMISTPPMTNMTITTCTAGNAFDSAILVFPSCNADTCVAFNDDAPCSYNNLASTAQVTSGNMPTDYYIAIVGYNGSVGFFDLTITWE